jgi:hypothetical protein
MKVLAKFNSDINIPICVLHRRAGMMFVLQLDGTRDFHHSVEHPLSQPAVIRKSNGPRKIIKSNP